MTGSYAVSVIGGIILVAVSFACLLFIQAQAKRKTV